MQTVTMKHRLDLKWTTNSDHSFTVVVIDHLLGDDHMVGPWGGGVTYTYM